MDDLKLYVESTFSILTGCIATAVDGDCHGILGPLRDPHRAADEWLAADDTKRRQLSISAEVLLQAVIRENAHLLRESAPKPYERDRETQLAHQARWRAAHREHSRRHAQQYRDAMKASDPEKYARVLELARARKARAKAAKQAIVSRAQCHTVP